MILEPDDITMTCVRCGRVLDIAKLKSLEAKGLPQPKSTFEVDLCIRCLQRETSESYDKGYERGVSDGRKGHDI